MPFGLVPDEVYEMQAELGRLIASPKRLEILYHLRDGEKTFSEIVDALESSKTNVSQNLALLRTKGILKTRREGVHIYYALSSEKMKRACELMRSALMELVHEA